MKYTRTGALWWLVLALVVLGAPTVEAEERTLLEARKGFRTKLTRIERDTEPLEQPPASLFSIVKYPTAIGEMAAYLSPAPKGGGKHPAIIWIIGGFPPGGAGSIVWEAAHPSNDQSAAQYREAGIVMMYPALRGSAGNPGKQECFLGEVDDVLAALAYLRTVDYVDPARIYLGGHSTGGTLALLVSEVTDGFRAVFAFGPVASPAGYGSDSLTYDVEDEAENFVRSPINFLGGIRSPTFVVEGQHDGNIESLRAINESATNRALKCIEIPEGNHFDILAPLNRLIAKKIVDLTTRGSIRMTASECRRDHQAQLRATREAADLSTLANLRGKGVDLDAEHRVLHTLLSRSDAALKRAAVAARRAGFEAEPIETRKDRAGQPYSVLILRKRLKLDDLSAVFAASAVVARLQKEHDLYYDGWTIE